MSKAEIEKIAENNGFELWAVLPGGKVYQFIDGMGVNLIVHLNEDNTEFELKTKVPSTIFEITCPKCSPFNDGAHFRTMLRKFRRIIMNNL